MGNRTSAGALQERRKMRRIQPARWLALLVVALLSPSAPAAAQGGSAIGNAVIALWSSNSSTAGDIQTMNGRLFGAIVFARVLDVDKRRDTLAAEDRVLQFDLRLPGAGGRLLASFPAAAGGSPRADFITWVNANAGTLVNAFFPTSLSEATSGVDIASNNAQQFLQSIALEGSAPAQPGRRRVSEAGGLFEYESFGGGDRSGFALQGLYKIRRDISVLARYAQQNENETPSSPDVPVTATSSKSINAAVDYHPSRVINEEYDWRVGLDAHTGLFFARSTTMNFGHLDYGAGGWTSARRDFSRVRIGVGSLLGATKDRLPTSFLPDSGDVQALADAFNSRDVQNGMRPTRRSPVTRSTTRRP
jgi:hypothetical protein